MSETQASYGAFVRRLFNRSGDPSKDFAHAILGIATEIHEFLSATDEVNALEERGDLRFYQEALQQVVLDFTGTALLPRDPESLVQLFEEADDVGVSVVIASLVNSLLDDAKRWVGYGKEPKSLNEVVHCALDLIEFVSVNGQYRIIDEDRIIAANMAKLLVRYPGGDFDQYRALVRDLDGERAVLASA